ncbi:MAG TPA: MFS transporter [Candidatus Paceibacterota bacterium]|nr:MFS transporter [Candidatus Paceibacterota bacterium]
MSKTIRAILPFLISGFLFSMILSSTAYFNSTFIETNFLNTKPGIWYTIGSIIVLFVSLRLPHIQSKIGNRKLILIILSILSFSLLGLSMPASPISLLFFVTFLATGTITLSSLDIFIEKYSSDQFTGRIRGIYLTSLNLAWIFSPLLGSLFIGENENFGLLYKIAFFMSLVVIIVISISSKNFIDDKYKHHELKDFILALKDKNIRGTLALQFTLQFFYAWMVIYTPIYLHESLGIPWGTIGKMFLLMLIPFVLIQYPLGRLADKKHDEKEFLAFGFLLAGISTAIFGIVGAGNVIFLAIILFFTRVGAATIEIMNESYFFKQINSNEPTKVSIFRMMYPSAYIIAPILAIPIISNNNFPLFYLILSLILASTLFIIKRLK